MQDFFRRLIPRKLDSLAAPAQTTDNSWFSYKRLGNGKKDIRLLKRSQSLSGSVRYELVHVSLKRAKKMRYSALSYTWGPDEPPTLSICFANGKLLQVGDNLHRILKHPSLFDGKEYLWIDAICINQKDNAEKGLQVARMRDIYSCAEEVIVWVGEQDQDSDLTMDAVEKLMDYFPNVDVIFENKDHPECAAAYESLTKSFREIDPILHPHWDLSCMGRFISRPWFERVWIIQEVVLGQKVRLCCGQRSIDWNVFAYVILSLQRYNLSKLLMDTTTRLHPTGWPTCSLLASWRVEAISGDSDFRSLASNLASSSYFKSKDPRDKIYALLGISSRSNDGTVPDYECTVQLAFINSTRSILLRCEGLLVLSAAGIGFPHSILDLPSWVPDWTSTAGRSFISICPDSGFHAADNQPPQVRATSDPSLLAIDGIHVDKIIAVHALPPVHSFRRHDVEGYNTALISEKEFRSSSTKFALDTNPSLPVEEREEILWRTLCANLDGNGELMSKEYGKYYRSRLLMGELPELTPNNWTKQEVDRRQSLAIEGAVYVNAFKEWGSYRRLCRTARGFLGLVAPETKINDSVCVLLGGDAPFVLRQSDPTPDGRLTYTLVGECYVHGLMNGEGVRMGEVQEFILG